MALPPRPFGSSVPFPREPSSAWDLMERGEKLGEGTFSTVYAGIPIGEPSTPTFAVKELHAFTAPDRILEEMQFLHLLGGKRNTVKLLRGFRAHDKVYLVTEYIECESFKDSYLEFTLMQCKAYLYELLLALDYVHSKGIVHRDVKPSNFLANTATSQYALIDFGLAHYESQFPPKLNYPEHHASFASVSYKDRPSNHAPRMGTRGFRPPEVLLRCERLQTTKIDLWAVGVILMSLLTGKYPFFSAPDDTTNLAEIMALIGSDAMERGARSIGMYLKVNERVIVGPWRDRIRDLRRNLQSTGFSDAELMEEMDALEQLLEGLFAVDPRKRWSAKEAMECEWLRKYRLWRAEHLPDPDEEEAPVTGHGDRDSHSMLLD